VLDVYSAIRSRYVSINIQYIMRCDICDEKLDERDIIDSQLLHCWKCGFKRQLSDAEISIYITPTFGYTEWEPDISYMYEI
jgi:hypothetical protein